MILGKFWSRFDLRQRRNRNFLGDDQGCLSKRTVLVRAGTAVLQLCTQPYVHEQGVIVAVTVPLFIYIKSSKILQEVRGRVLNNSVEG